MVKIIWIMTALLSAGPTVIDVHDIKTFESVAECKAFGFENANRMADWVRGALKVSLDKPVQVSFKCDDGTPA